MLNPMRLYKKEKNNNKNISVYVKKESEVCPKQKTFYFTFGSAHMYPFGYIELKGTYSSTREEMFKHFGDKWAFQYSEDDWNEEGEPQNKTYNLTKINLPTCK